MRHHRHDVRVYYLFLLAGSLHHVVYVACGWLADPRMCAAVHGIIIYLRYVAGDGDGEGEGDHLLEAVCVCARSEEEACLCIFLRAAALTT